MTDRDGDRAGFRLSFSKEALEGLVREFLKERDDVRLRGSRAVEVREAEGAYEVALHLHAREGVDLVTLGEEIQRAVFDQLSVAAGIEPARVDVHIEKLYGG